MRWPPPHRTTWRDTLLECRSGQGGDETHTSFRAVVHTLQRSEVDKVQLRQAILECENLAGRLNGSGALHPLVRTCLSACSEHFTLSN